LGGPIKGGNTTRPNHANETPGGKKISKQSWDENSRERRDEINEKSGFLGRTEEKRTAKLCDRTPQDIEKLGRDEDSLWNE